MISRTASFANANAARSATVGKQVVGLPALRPSVKLQRRTITPVNALGGMEVVSAVSQIASTIAIGVGAYMLLGKEMSSSLEQDRFNGSQAACPRCEGRGFEPCMCTRWSDGDVGCSTCNRTGYMKCRSCGGGGIAMRVTVPIRKNDGNRML